LLEGIRRRRRFERNFQFLALGGCINHFLESLVLFGKVGDVTLVEFFSSLSIVDER